MPRLLIWIGCALLLATASVAGAAESPVRVEPAFLALHFNASLFLTYPLDGTDRLFIVEQAGRVLWFDNRPDVAAVNVAIDLRNKVRSGGEEGLFCIAFHPDFKTNHQVFLHYTQHNPRRNTLSRFTMDGQHKTIDSASEEVILEILQPYANHNGGMIAFGPDRMLYIALGDGGSGGDPHNNGQNKNTLLGKILRIDVDHQTPPLNYAIPADNPFAKDPAARGEVWAYGLRNPWRFSFDRQTGDLWAGDVGQDRWEEIDVITKGGNYGWRLREGRHDFRPVRPMPADLIEPVAEHSHEQAKCITGGYVYRGKKIPALGGAYIYGDYVTNVIWMLAKPGAEPVFLAQAPNIASFGEDRDGEVYLVSLGGTIYRFAAK